MNTLLTNLEPALVLLLLLATACASLAHTLWGKRWLQLPVFWLAAVVGALIAYVIGLRVLPGLPAPAGVPILETVLAAWTMAFVAAHLRV